MSSTSKRLAKNTAFMYTRMLVMMLISLFTARIILKQLGIEDYGIYNVVGSILAMFNSLRSIFASSTQRYLNYEMGVGSPSKLKLVFNLSIRVNLLISVLIFVLVELVGLWFIHYKINIDPSRLYAADVIFQLSVISVIISIFSSTFNAEIIAHEKMNFYAYISILESILQLGVVGILSISTSDKLILYSGLLLCVHLLIFFVSFYYCRKNFEEARFELCNDKEYFKKMTKFAGWNFFGNTAFAMTQNVLNMLLNVFGGPIVNAARGVSYQVKGLLDQFVTNINTVLVPYSIKIKATGDDAKFFTIILFSSKLLFFVQYALSIIVAIFTGELIEIWLGDTPSFTVSFIHLILLWSVVRSLHYPIDTIFKAFGDLKYYQITECIVLSLPILLSYIVLRLYCFFEVIYISLIICEFIDVLLIVWVAKCRTGFPFDNYFKSVILPFSIILSFGILCFCLSCVYNSFLHKLILSVLCIILSSLFLFFKCLNSNEKRVLINIIKK